MALSTREQQIVKRARSHGIVNPEIAFTEWKRIKVKPMGFDFALLCALLVKETSGGINEFGHDPTIFIGAGKVTKAKYLSYRALRNVTHRFQGVGGTQLTYGGYQDEADKLGGCWVPQWQMRVGFGIVRGNVERHGLWAGIAAYNGSGPAAVAYANSVLAMRKTWEHLLSGVKLDPQLLTLDHDDEPDMDALAGVAEEHDKMRAEDPLWLPH